MSQIKTSLALALALLAFLGVLSLGGCGDTNHESDYDPDSGKHPSNWLPSGHAAAATNHGDTCVPCHGNDLLGGISKVSCSTCHLGGAGGVHPANWNDPVHGNLGYALHADYVRQNGTASCANIYCHGANLQGAAGPSCSSCHMGGPTSVHPLDWERRFTTAPGIAPTELPAHGPYVVANGAARCLTAVCHGTNGEGVYLSGRSCRACHF